METNPTQVMLRFGVWNASEDFVMKQNKLTVRAGLLFGLNENELHMVGKAMHLEDKKSWNSLEMLQEKVNQKVTIVRDASFTALFHALYKDTSYEDISVEPNSSLWKDVLLRWKPKKNITLSVTIDDKVLHTEVVEMGFGETKEINLWDTMQGLLYERFPKNDVTFNDSLVRVDYNSHDKNFKIQTKYFLSLLEQQTNVDEEHEDESEVIESDDGDVEMDDKQKKTGIEDYLQSTPRRQPIMDSDESENSEDDSSEHVASHQSASGRSKRDHSASMSKIKAPLVIAREEEHCF